MSGQKHTPGPWGFMGTEQFGYAINHGPPGILADSIMSQANARLIAAAPDLLEALRALADVSRTYLAHMDADDIVTLEQARAAIARATEG